MNLFELDSKIEEIAQSAVDPETGEVLDDELVKGLESLEEERNKKIENTALFIKSKRAFANAIAGEIAALQARKKAAERMADGAEKYLAAYMNGEKFATPRVSISWRNTQKVVVPDVLKLPKEYLRYKDPEPDKVKINKVLKAGGKVEGASLIPNRNIVLK